MHLRRRHLWCLPLRQFLPLRQPRLTIVYDSFTLSFPFPQGPIIEGKTFRYSISHILLLILPMVPIFLGDIWANVGKVLGTSGLLFICEVMRSVVLLACYT